MRTQSKSNVNIIKACKWSPSVHLANLASDKVISTNCVMGSERCAWVTSYRASSNIDSLSTRRICVI